MLPQATADHYRRQQRLTVTTVAANRRAWSAMTDDFDASWRVVSPRLSLITSAGQLAAAQGGINYLPEVLAETGQIDRPAATVVARAFAGVAADGRPLDSMLYGAVTNAKQAVAQGVPTVEALARGGRWLDMATQTTIADAGRVATGVGIVTRPDIGGYVRNVNMPSCSRCQVLAGKFYRYNQGFARHQRCDCSHTPSSRDQADDFITSPPADLGPVNLTTVSIGTQVEQIYSRTADRTQAIELLRRYGYVR